MKVRLAQLLLLAVLALGLSACGTSNAHVKNGPWIWSPDWKDSELTHVSADRLDPTASVRESRNAVAPAGAAESRVESRVETLPVAKKRSAKKRKKGRRR